MMKKEKTLRMAVTGALLLTVVAAGISMQSASASWLDMSPSQQLKVLSVSLRKLTKFVRNHYVLS